MTQNRSVPRLLAPVRWTIEPPPPAPEDHPGRPPREPAEALRWALELGRAAGVLDRQHLSDRAFSLASPDLDDCVEALTEEVLARPAPALSHDAEALLAALEQLSDVVVVHDLARGPWPHAVAEPLDDLIRSHDGRGLDGVVFTTWRDLEAAVGGDGLWLHAHAPFAVPADPEASRALADRLADHLDQHGLPTYRAPGTPSVMVPVRWRRTT